MILTLTCNASTGAFLGTFTAVEIEAGDQRIRLTGPRTTVHPYDGASAIKLDRYVIRVRPRAWRDPDRPEVRGWHISERVARALLPALFGLGFVLGEYDAPGPLADLLPGEVSA